DLELVEINGKRRKCRILSNELIEKLREIYSEGNTGYNPPIKFIDFELDKKKLLQEDAKISSDGVLWVNFVIKTTTDPALHISDFSLFFYQEKANETKYVRPYALGQINLIIKKGNIDLTTLADSGLFLNESYMSDPTALMSSRKSNQSITETELNNNRPNWQNHLRSLKNRKDITDYQTKQLEKDIENLVSAKKKNEEERQQAEAEA
ncbi:17872_t:CDS:2, partial [Racocetra persica]